MRRNNENGMEAADCEYPVTFQCWITISEPDEFGTCHLVYLPRIAYLVEDQLF